MKTFISQNINKIKLALFPKSIVLVATCTYHEGNDEFHAILQLAKPTDLDSSGNYNTLTAVAAPYNVNVIEEIQRSWGIFGYPIAFNIREFPDSEFRSFSFTGDSVTQELDTPVDLFNGINGNPKSSSLAAFASFTWLENKYAEECFIMPADWDQWIGESDLMIRAGSSTCHFVISDASSYTCIQNLINYSNEGFFMIFTESENLGNNTKLFARDIATLNDTTVYSVGATFIATKKFTWQDVDM